MTTLAIEHGRADVGRDRLGPPRAADRDVLPKLQPVERLLLWVPFFAVVLVTFNATSEDPLITLRYAANIVHGLGPVFNQGQRVEGFTSPLHLVVDVGVMLIPGGAKLVEAKLASLLFGALAIYQASRLVRMVGLPPWARKLSLALIGGSWIIGFADGNGLETSLACWLITALIVQLVAGRGQRRPVQTAVVAGLCVLARPDALAVVLLLLVVSLLVETEVSWWHRAAWATGAVAVAILSTAARLAYYAMWLPNTYYAKEVGPSTAIPKGVLYLTKSLVPGAGTHGWAARGALALTIIPVMLLILGTRLIVREHRRWLYLPGAVVAQAAFILKAGGDWMSGGRFLAPVVPALILIEVIGLVAVVDYLAARHRVSSTRTQIVLIGAMVALAIAPLLALHGPIWATSGQFTDSAIMAHGGNGTAGIWLTGERMLSCAKPGALVAYSEMGYAPFARQDLRFLDVRGLVDKQISRSAPAAMKTWFGVDPFVPASSGANAWTSSTSVVGRVIVQDRPDLILTFDFHGKRASLSVLDGRYVEVERVELRNAPPLVLYRRTDVVCTAPSEQAHSST